MKVLFDSNVIIDALSERDDFNAFSEMLFLEAVDGRHIQGYLASKQLTDIYYVLRKYVNDERVRKDFINLLIRAFKIINTKQSDLLGAFSLNGKDYEDDILMYMAELNELDYIVTNDLEDFSTSSVKVLSPKQLAISLKLCNE